MKNEFGHIFLKRMGKNVLRPGGIEGTKFLFNNYDMTKKQKFLEAACNKGVNLMKLCMKYPHIDFYGVDIDKSAIEEAEENFSKKGINNCRFFHSSASNLSFEDESIDVILTEAMFTMVSYDNKVKILKEYYRILKRGGILLTHDIIFKKVDKMIKKDMSEVVNANLFPEEINSFKSKFKDSGFCFKGEKVGELTVLSFKGLIKDEGFFNALKVVKNGLKSENRNRFLNMMKVFSKHKNNLKYIALIHEKI